MPDRYRRVLSAIREHPWAIWPAMFDTLLDIVELRASGEKPSSEARAAAIEAAQKPRQVASAPGAIAVIPVYGILSHRMYLMNEVSSSGTSAEALQLAVTGAAQDPNIGAIMLDIDSPGGSVFGIEELGDAIYSARQQKPVVAVANSMAASAAYWIGTQADELVVTPSGQVGSVGVIAAHDDVSGAAAQKGVKRTYITAGKYKAEGNPFEPLEDEARAYIQSEVDRYYDSFVRAVARGRKVSLTSVRENFGQGRMKGASQAVAAGMADREGTMQETIDRMAKKLSKGGGARADDTERAKLRLQLAQREAVA